MKNKIAVGLSGGIDSSFAAYLLKKQGWEVVGFTLKFYPEENRCCDLDSLYQAKRLCDSLGIPHYIIDVGELFRKEIINYFINSYLAGTTPNPCAFCNRLIKFGYFFEKIKSLGIDYLATGHYARVIKKAGNFLIQRAKDQKKSQEYFLALIKKEILPCLNFPLADFTKEEVKKIAQKEKIMFKERKESQDICFVKEKPYTQFIEKNIELAGNFTGEIRHIEGKVLGRHRGIHYFTCGQREGLGIAWKEPLYVINIDAKTKTVTVGERKYLAKNSFMVTALNWFIAQAPSANIKVKIRYNSPLYDCKLESKDDKVLVLLKEKIDAITPGQAAAFYDKDWLIGGGIIEKEIG
jgi:tRNA-specific 2-thiouridylase